jgi:hypothetical protein
MSQKRKAAAPPGGFYSTREAANLLGFTGKNGTDIVVGEIRDGRLRCRRRIVRPSGRTVYRVHVKELRAWAETHSPSLLEELPPAARDLES